MRISMLHFSQNLTSFNQPSLIEQKIPRTQTFVQPIFHVQENEEGIQTHEESQYRLNQQSQPLM